MKQLCCLVLGFMLLTACSPAVNVTPSPEPTIPPPTETAAPPTVTPTEVLPTATPEPTLTAVPSPTPTPAIINSETGSHLALRQRYGDGRMEQVTWSPDGKAVAVLTSVHLMRVDGESGEVAWKIETGPAQQQVAFTGDGKKIVTMGAGGAARVWDAQTGKLLNSPIPQQTNILYASLAQNGSIVAMTSYKRETSIWDVETGVQLYTNHGVGVQAQVAGVLAGPDGSWFATSTYDDYGPNQQIRIWDVKTGQPLVGLLGINNDFIADLAASPDGKYVAGISRLAISSTPEISLVVWDAKTGGQLKRFPQVIDIVSFTFSGENTILFSTQNGQLQTASISTGKVASGYPGAIGSPLYTLAISSDDARLATVNAEGSLRIWNANDHKQLHKTDLKLSSHASPFTLLGYNYILRSPCPFAIGAPADGSFVAMPSTDRTSLTLIDPASLLPIQAVGKIGRPLYAVAVSTDGKWAAAAEYGTVYVWDLATGKQKQVIETKQRSIIQKLMFSPDGSLIYSLSHGELYGYEVETGTKIQTMSGYNTLDFSPDGAYVISDNVDFGLYFWDAETSRQLALQAADWILDLDYSPDGATIAIGGWEMHKDIKEHTNLVTFMDSTSYAMSDMQLYGHPASIAHVRYSPDGSLLATLDDYGNLMLWDVTTGELQAQFEGVAPAPGYLEFLSAGRTLVVGSADGALRFYEISQTQ